MSTWVFYVSVPSKAEGEPVTTQCLVCALHLGIAYKARGQPSADTVPALGRDPSDTGRCPRPQGWPRRGHVEAPSDLCLSPWDRARALGSPWGKGPKLWVQAGFRGVYILSV